MYSKDQVIDKVLAMLNTNTFEKWNSSGNFNALITGDMEWEKKITYEQAKEVIKADLAKMLNLKD